MFSAQQDTQVIQQAIEAGVSAYVVDGLNTGRVKPILDAAVARFKQFNTLRDELSTTKDKLVERDLVVNAKRLLIKHHGVDEPEAYRMLRRTSMDRRVRMEVVAQSAIDWLQGLEGSKH
jgi:response regulator NasT